MELENEVRPENFSYSSASVNESGRPNQLDLDAAIRLQRDRGEMIRKERIEKLEKVGNLPAGGSIVDAGRRAIEEGKTRDKYDRDLAPKTPDDPGNVLYSLAAERDTLVSLLQVQSPAEDLSSIPAKITELSQRIAVLQARQIPHRGFYGFGGTQKHLSGT